MVNKDFFNNLNINSIEKIIRDARDAIILINDKGDICYWNNSATRIFGYTENEALG